jgi:septal ring factor EnvC (AmiA/AmiB activator)
MSLAKELAKLKAALDAPWPEEIWKAKAEIAERELSATKDEYCKTAFALTEQTDRAEKAEAEVKEIRNALGDKGQRTHKELLELASKASHWREWKEKYIDLRNAHIAEGQDPAGTIWEHADKIQQELKASKADVAKLNHQLLKTESDLIQSQDINSFLDIEFRIACKQTEKAEAEVERLREQLASTKQLAIKFWEALEENGFKLELPK